MQNWKIRIAPSLGGGFAGTPQETWGVENYENDLDDPTVFMGLYGLPDFYTLWRHKGRKCIFWCGSDIRHFLDGYFLDKEGWIKLDPTALALWIHNFCESYVENEVERKVLLRLGIESKVVPSFLGNVKDYQVSYAWSEKPKVYTSVSGDDFELYGWDKIPVLALANPDIEFHLYGNTKSPGLHEWSTVHPHNVIVHGRVPQEQMNREIKEMQGALRLTEFDGFSEIIAKSLLWGQYPISLINYPHTLKPENIRQLKILEEPNHEGREWLLSEINKYPWTLKI